MKKKDAFPMIGMVFCAVIVLLGLLGVFGAYTGKLHHGSDSYGKTSQDSGYASFGADFYTYVNNNAAIAAKNVETAGENAAAAAENAGYAARAISTVGGIILLALGGIGFCFFGHLYNKEKAEESAFSSTNSFVSYLTSHPYDAATPYKADSAYNAAAASPYSSPQVPNASASQIPASQIPASQIPAKPAQDADAAPGVNP